MTNYNYIVILIASVFFSFTSISQCPPPGSVMKADIKAGWGPNSQSKSGPLQAGETYEYTFIAQKGLEYRLTALGGLNNIRVDNVEFELYDTEVQKVVQDGKPVYKRMKKMIFDSKSEESGSQVVFSSPKTRKLTLEVSVVNNEAPNAVQCVVVFVETRKATQLGLK